MLTPQQHLLSMVPGLGSLNCGLAASSPLGRSWPLTGSPTQHLKFKMGNTE